MNHFLLNFKIVRKVFGHLQTSSKVFRKLRICSCRLRNSWYSPVKNLTPLTQKKLAGILFIGGNGLPARTSWKHFLNFQIWQFYQKFSVHLVKQAKASWKLYMKLITRPNTSNWFCKFVIPSMSLLLIYYLALFVFLSATNFALFT